MFLILTLRMNISYYGMMHGIDHFHNSDKFKYSFMCILISLLGLVSMTKIAKNFLTQTRPRRLIKMHIKEYLNLSELWKWSLWSTGCARQDKTRQDKTRQDKTRQDKTRQDKTRQDKTRQDKTRQDKTRQDKTRQDKTRQDKTRSSRSQTQCQ